MPNATYREIPELLRQRKPFNGNTMHAYSYHASAAIIDNDDPVVYVVMSYHTDIAYVHASGRVVINDAKYSATTSRHQNLCRAYLTQERLFD